MKKTIIEAVREQLGKSQSQMAEILKIDNREYYETEVGKSFLNQEQLKTLTEIYYVEKVKPEEKKEEEKKEEEKKEEEKKVPFFLKLQKLMDGIEFENPASLEDFNQDDIHYRVLITPADEGLEEYRKNYQNNFQNFSAQVYCKNEDYTIKGVGFGKDGKAVFVKVI